MFALAVTTGLRPGEYLALKRPDLHVMTGTPSVNRTLQWVKGGGWQFQDTKRTGSRRMVKLPSAICAMLEEHRICQEKERMDAGQNWRDTGLIFTTRTGGPLDERNIAQENFLRILTAAGLPTIRLYDLRHTAATTALLADVPAGAQLAADRWDSIISDTVQCNESGLCFFGRRSLLGVLLGCRLEKCIEEGVEIEAVRFRRSNMPLQISVLATPLRGPRALIARSHNRASVSESRPSRVMIAFRGWLTWAGKPLQVVPDFITHAAERGEPLRFGTLHGRRIFKVTVEPIGMTRINRARLSGAVANRQHIIERPAREFINRLRPVPGNIDSHFLHDGNRLRPDLAGLGSRTLDLEVVRRVMAQKALGHLAPRRISRAQDQHLLLIRHAGLPFARGEP